MKKFVFAIMLSVALSFGVGLATSVSAAPTDAAKQAACEGIQGTTGGTCANSFQLQNAIRAVLSILSWIAGVAAIIMIVISGLKYTTSGGDSSSVASAKHTLIYAIVGLIIVGIAQFLVRFVITATK